jgi:hypothetical protein
MAITRPTTKTVISTTQWGVPITDEVNRLSPIVDGRTPTAWTNVTLQNGWVNAPGYTTQYRKIGDIVYLRGRVQGGTMQTTCFTLPSGFRPPMQMDMATASADAGGNWIFGQIQIGTDGQVNPRTGTNVAMTFNLNFSTI